MPVTRRQLLVSLFGLTGVVLMPTSNGQVGSRDIRQKAIKTSHVFPAAIDTTELADLAASVDKVEDPIFVLAGESEPFINPTLTTTHTEQASMDVTIPSWVGLIHVFGVANVQMANSSGGDQNLNVSCRVNDEDDGARSMTTLNGDTGSLDHFESVSISTPGSTVQISVYAWVQSGTNAANNGTVWAIVLGER